MTLNRRCLSALLAAILIVSTAIRVSADAPPKPRTVAFLIWENVELIEFTGPAQIFEFAPGFEGFTVGPTTKPVHSYFVTIVPQYSFANCPQPDVVVIPAGSQMMRSQELTAFLRRVVPNAEAVLTVCNGSLVLANTGLLDGHIATTPHSNLDDLAILGKNIRPCANRRFVESGKFVTANSYFAGVDAALYLVGKLAGEQAAKQSADGNLYDWRPQDFAAELAHPLIAPPSRRRLAYDTLMTDGLDAALARYRQLLKDGEPKDALASDIPDESLLRYLCWNLQSRPPHRRSPQARPVLSRRLSRFTDGPRLPRRGLPLRRPSNRRHDDAARRLRNEGRKRLRRRCASSPASDNSPTVRATHRPATDHPRSVGAGPPHHPRSPQAARPSR